MAGDLLHRMTRRIRATDLGRQRLVKVRQGRIWPMLRDRRPWAGCATGAAHRLAPDWKEEHGLGPPANAKLILQQTLQGFGWVGVWWGGWMPSFNAPDLRVCLVYAKASCLGHLRRDFHTSGHRPNPRSPRALTGSGNSYDVERGGIISGQPVTSAYAARQNSACQG